MMTTVYGIKNCDTVKKARKWLEAQGIAYQFHDFRVDGLESDQVQSWIAELGWENLVNKRSTTWKQLDSKARDTMDDNAALSAIIEHPTLIKRPLLDTGKRRLVGFNKNLYQSLFVD
jgi:arsenate reductase (glutaredoxin)